MLRWRQNQPSEIDKERWKFTLEEYVQTKRETLYSIRYLHFTVQIGLTALSLLIAAVVSVWSEPLAPVLLLIVVPIVCMLIVRLYVAELFRMARASYFLWRLEIVLEKDFGSMNGSCVGRDMDLPSPGPLRWEGWVRGKNAWNKNLLMTRSYETTLYFLAAISISSLGVGWITLLTRISLRKSWPIMLLSLLWIMFAVIVIVRERNRTYSAIEVFGQGAT